jgi:hypothetical protein
MGYEIRLRDGHSMRLDTLALIDTLSGYVVFIEDDGKVTDAKHVATYEKTMLAEKRLRKVCNGHRLQFERYFKQTGKRFEVERKAEADAKRAVEHAAKKRREAKRNAAEELYAACAELIRGADKPGDHLQNAIDLARAALAKADAQTEKVNS